MPDAGGVVHSDQIGGRAGVDGQLAVGADDLGGVLLTGGHGAAAEELSDGAAAAVELDHRDGVVAVVVATQSGACRRDAHRAQALDRHRTAVLVAEEPECQVDVMDGAVDEDAARQLGITDEEAGPVQLVARLRAEDDRLTDYSGPHLGVRVAVGGVKAAREAADCFLGRVPFQGLAVGRTDGLGLKGEERMSESRGCWGVLGTRQRTYDFNAGAQRLLAEDMETHLDGSDGLLGVDGGGTCDNDCLETFCFLFSQHLVVVFVQSDSLEGLRRPGPLFVVRRRGCHEVGSRSQVVEVLGVTGSHPPEARNGDVELWSTHCKTPDWVDAGAQDFRSNSFKWNK